MHVELRLKIAIKELDVGMMTMMTTDKMIHPSLEIMIPLLDIHLYHSNPTEFVKKLQEAFHTVGFLLLRHDLTPPELAPRMLNEARLFFDASLEQKQTISYEDSPAFRGYMQLGVENTGGQTDMREQVEFAVEQDSATNIDSECLIQPLHDRLRGRNPWPDLFQPSLKPCAMDYVKQMCRIAHDIRQAMCLALGLDKHDLDSLFDDATGEDPPHWVLKMISYPHSNDSSCSFGVGAHTDTNFLTLVLQDSVGGLQVFSEGKWIDVPSKYGADVLVCNIGEQAQILSDGYFLATPHRVLSSDQQRISVPLFYNPKLSARIQPLVDASSIDLEWRRRHGHKHWKRDDNAMLETVGDNTFKSLARSHPRVFQKHHADLLLMPDGHIIRRVDANAAAAKEPS
jgi:isopenicillin N synthase-like dioxygenase